MHLNYAFRNMSLLQHSTPEKVWRRRFFRSELVITIFENERQSTFGRCTDYNQEMGISLDVSMRIESGVLLVLRDAISRAIR